MSNILNDLGIDKDKFDWYDFAICKGMEVDLFFEKYETDVNIANSIDQACLSCPVSKMCYQSGVQNSDHGVWGGFYLNSGVIDKSKNLHKSSEITKRLKKKNG